MTRSPKLGILSVRLKSESPGGHNEQFEDIRGSSIASLSRALDGQRARDFGAVLQVEAGVVTVEAAGWREVTAAQDVGGLVKVDV
jgi:hypothetical protein